MLNSFSGLSPFSGLSLLIHLLVIAIFTLLSFVLWKEKAVLQPVSVVEDTFLRRALKSGLSVVIVLVLSAIMIVSFAIAVRTGFREGASEPHMIFIRREITQLHEEQIAPLADSFRVQVLTFIKSLEMPAEASTIEYTRINQ